MKKYTFLIFTIILFVTGILFPVESKNNIKIFTGRVINVLDESIELKKGYKEIVLEFSDDSVFLTKDGSEADGFPKGGGASCGIFRFG